MRQRVRRLGSIVLEVQRRFSEVGGGTLASAVTLAMFLSLFPILLVAIAVVGFMSAGDSTIADDVIRNLSLTGDAANTIRDAIDAAERSRRTASIVGFLSLLWAGLGAAAAIQYAIDKTWQVQGRGIKDKLIAVAWLIGGFALLASSSALVGVATAVPGFGRLAALAGIVVNIVLFWWTLKVLGPTPVGWRAHLPGAVFAAIGFHLLTLIGAFYVPRLVASSSGLYGSIGVVFAILAWLFFFGRLIVYASVLNVVLHERSKGTVRVEIEVPHLPGQVPLEANRDGAVAEVVAADR